MRSIRRVLVVHPYGIGDLLFVTPTLRALRVLPTVEKVDLLLGSRTKDLIQSNPHVDEIYVQDKDRAHSQGFFKNLKENIELGKKLKENHYDLMIDYSSRREYAFFGKWYLKIPRRLGFDYKKRGRFHTHPYPLLDGFKDRHVLEDYCDLTEKIGILVENRQMEVYLTEESVKNSEKILSELGISPTERIITVAPGGGESWGKDASLKRWPIEYFHRFLSALPKQTSFDKLVILGSAKESDLAKKLVEALDYPCVDLTGKLNLLEAASVIKRSQLFIGNDGGLVHVAHALRTPVIAFYGPADPKVYGPFPESPRALAVYMPENPARPCYAKFRYNTECRCLKDLTPERAWDVIESRKYFEALQPTGAV